MHWQRDPELARLIRGTPGESTPGFSETKDGRSLFFYLKSRGSRDQPHVQSEMSTEWATVYSEAHTHHPTKTVFSDTSTSDAVIKQLNTLLETYEAIAANRGVMGGRWPQPGSHDHAQHGALSRALPGVAFDHAMRC